MDASVFSPTRSLYCSNWGELFIGCSSFVHGSDLLIDPCIALGHHRRRKIALHMQARPLAVDLMNLRKSLHHLIEMRHQEACFAIHHNLRGCAASEGEDRAAERHRFAHNDGKGYLPVN